MEMLIVVPFYFMSAAAVVLGVYLLRRTRHLRKRGKVTMAVIIKNIGKTGSRTGMNYYPVVRFETEDKRSFTHEMITGYNPAKPEGSAIEIVYDPLNPTNVQANTTFELRVLPKLIIGLGCLFMLVAIMMTVA